MFTLGGCVSPGLRQVGLGQCEDGVRHGGYQLRVVDGPVIATGSFVDGKKSGVFTFYSTRGTKLAEIPYADDVKSGTIRLWYGDSAYPEAAGRLKLEAQYTNDVANGQKQTWFPSGAKRYRAVYRDGSLVEAEAWNEAGGILSTSQAEQMLVGSAEADAKYYRILESEIDAYPPACVQH